MRLLSALAMGLWLALFMGASLGAPYDIPREFDAGGPYTQAASGMTFPETIAGFSRAGLVRYDSEGTEESADYVFDDGTNRIVATVYVYPVPLNLGSALAEALGNQQFARNKRALAAQLFAEEEDIVLQSHPGAEVVDEQEAYFDQRGTSHPGFSASFRYEEEFFGDVRAVISELRLFPMVGENWMVKYRITYPDGFDGSGKAMEFVDSLPWTIKGVRY